MRPTVTASTPPVRGARGLRAGLVAVATALAMTGPPAIAASTTVDAAGPPARPPGGVAAAASPGGGSAAGGETRQVTLLTGDVVVWHRTADGQQTAWVEKAAAGAAARPPVIYRDNRQVHVVPAEALPYVESGVLDENLFNVSLLVREGYHDQARRAWPLLLQGRGPLSGRRTPAAPARTREVRTLDSIGTLAITAPKRAAGDVWTSLRGPAAPVDATDARLQGAAKVWLNAEAHAALEDSVPQVGAPDAWAAGFDGEGVDVAVLDSGYDAAHPDLEGRVVKARDFSGDPHPPGRPALDLNGHGTHVAATVAGSGAASGGDRRGVAPGADLLIGKVLDRHGSGTMDEIIAGMEWAAHSGADVVNMSLGTFPTDGTDPLSQAVNRLTEESGTLFVVAAGNSGPDRSTVGAPGAADLALTVGAVTKSDAVAPFSSRGPRIGDHAIKPEVVAPGVDIVAARAAGTSLGKLLDESYTSMNGTSMASPHVAGAAAILAQQHPNWDAEELKTRLASTTRVLEDAPVDFQGAGRVDVAAAVTTPISVSAATLSVGELPQDSAPVTRELTYTNSSARPVRLRLSADVATTGSDRSERPALTFSRRVVTVPAGGRTSVEVRLDPRRTEDGVYAGRLTANRAGSAIVHTAISFAITGPEHTISVDAVDLAGEPAAGFVDVWSLDTGAWQRIWFDSGGASVDVPEGTYTVMTVIEPSDSGFFPTYQVLAGDPEVRVDGDVTVDHDARAASEVTVDVPRPADVDGYEVVWRRTVGDRAFWMHAAQGPGGRKLYALPGPRAQRGDFHVATQWQLTEPMLTAAVAGPDGFEISPRARFASPDDPYVGDARLPVVDAGAGTPQQYEDLDATGKVALATRNDETGLAAQVQAARKAGVALLLVINTGEGLWLASAWGRGLPTYRLDRGVGERLRAALAADRSLRLDVSGIADPTYSYELGFPEPAVPRRTDYRVTGRDLAVVESDYRQNSERMGRTEGWIPELGPVGIGNVMSRRRNGPVVRTEYVSAAQGIRWERFAQPHGEFLGFYWTWSALEQFEPGEVTAQTWWGPLVHPAVVPSLGGPEYGSPVARYRDAIRILMPHYSYGGTLHGHIDQRFGDSSELTLSRDGEVVGTAPWPEAQFTVPSDEAEYELQLRVANGSGNPFDTSHRTDTRWTFRSARPEEERSTLPLIQASYALEADGHNRVAVGSPYPLVVKPAYQPGAIGPGGFEVSVEVSYDEGETWHEAPVAASGDSFEATLPAADTDGFASVRTVVTDDAGNRLDQRIDRAWRLGS